MLADGARPIGAPAAPPVGGHLHAGGRFCPPGSVDTSAWWPVLPRPVGGHLRGGGRFWGQTRGTPRGAHRDARRRRYALAVSRRTPCPLDTPQRPSQSPSATTCCRLSWLNTFAIPARDHGPTPSSTSRSASSGGRFSGVHQWPVLGDYRGDSAVCSATRLRTAAAPTTAQPSRARWQRRSPALLLPS